MYYLYAYIRQNGTPITSAWEKEEELGENIQEIIMVEHQQKTKLQSWRRLELRKNKGFKHKNTRKEAKVVVCPHCNKSGGHFDNCKELYV